MKMKKKKVSKIIVKKFKKQLTDEEVLIKIARLMLRDRN